ncbi:MAG: ATP-binding protein [Streptomyces sp.]|nr:ATP-binding protein [Streptomyces sp.]
MWPPTPASVGKVRRLLVDHLAVWNLPHLADPAELIVSELVTNAVVHARKPRGHLIRTRFELIGSGVRIEVHDASEEKPDAQVASSDGESGRGLALVDALTSGRWGVGDRVGIGKMVWAVCTDDGTGAPR